MKPSEKRALEAEKKRRAAAAAGQEDGNSFETDYGYNASAGETEGYKRKEGFFQSHIRLITFIITAVIVITVISPIGIDLLIASRKDKVVDNKENMTIVTVYAVYDNAENMKWQHFEKYNYTDYSYDAKEGKYLVREYPISDSHLVLKVGGSSVNASLDYAQLIDYDTGKFVDVLKTDPHEFVKSIGQEEKK